jgi:hypothetical protein
MWGEKMRAYLLNSGRTKKEYWSTSWTKPKCLLPINDVTILDYQIDRFSKLKIEITLVLGYDAKSIEEYCEHFPYSLRYVYDKSWRGSYSIPRTLLDIEGVLRQEDDYTIFVHGDLLFNSDLVEAVVKAKGDICKIQGRNMIFKFSPEALHHILDTLKANPKIDTLNMPLWYKIMEKFPITEINPYLWHVDIDRPEVHNEYKKTRMLEPIG